MNEHGGRSWALRVPRRMHVQLAKDPPGIQDIRSFLTEVSRFMWVVNLIGNGLNTHACILVGP